jgi:hypothetical protein
METKRAVGHPGVWWAKIDGVEYPTVGAMRVTKTHYKQAYALDGWKSNDLLVALTAEPKVILCQEILQDNGIYKRTGYIALFTIKNLAVTTDETHKIVEFDLAERLCNLR